MTVFGDRGSRTWAHTVDHYHYTNPRRLIVRRLIVRRLIVRRLIVRSERATRPSLEAILDRLEGVSGRAMTNTSHTGEAAPQDDSEPC